MRVPNWVKWLVIIVLVYMFLHNPQQLVLWTHNIFHSIGVLASSFSSN